METNHHNPWQKHDDIMLRQLVEAGKSIKELADYFHRSEGAIYSRISHLGLSRTLSQSNNQASAGSPPVQNRSYPKNRKTVKGEYTNPRHGRVRIHFKTGLEISEDGKFIQKTYTDNKTKTEKRFSPNTHSDTNGREYINWSNQIAYIDEMVCTCFHGSPKSGQKVVHIDGDIGNCNASNLRWT